MKNDPLYIKTGRTMLKAWLWSIMGNWVFNEVRVSFDEPHTFDLVKEFCLSED